MKTYGVFVSVVWVQTIFLFYLQLPGALHVTDEPIAGYTCAMFAATSLDIRSAVIYYFPLAKRELAREIVF